MPYFLELFLNVVFLSSVTTGPLIFISGGMYCNDIVEGSLPRCWSELFLKMIFWGFGITVLGMVAFVVLAYNL